jgi:dipeptidyl aminopeptidase/acylaminoacyl peptidase
VTATDARPDSFREADLVRRYGPHSDQWVELWNPDARTHAGSPVTVVLIHGGYWRAPYTAELMRPLVPQFTARGWTVANVEYRRGADGWGALRDDLASALTVIRAEGPASRLAIIGHSVGGQLALLGGEEGDAVVALAPVTDVVRSFDEGVGTGAAAEFFRGAPDEIPDTYAAASPLAQVPPPAEVLIIHGTDDARVPIAHTRAYLEAAQATGGAVTLLEPPHLAHMDAIDPEAPHLTAVHEWLDRWAGR